MKCIKDIWRKTGHYVGYALYYPVVEKTEFTDSYRLIPKVMALTSDSIKNEINKLYDELKAIREMSDAEVCEEYNVDDKDEAVELLLEEMDDLWNDYGRLVDIEEREEHLEKESVLFSLRNPTRQLLMDY